MTSKPIEQQSVSGRPSVDEYLVERKHFQELGRDIADIIQSTVSDEQLDEIATKLLMLAIRRNQVKPTHYNALLAEILTILHRKKSNI